MNIHEYQAKALLRQYGAPVSDGRVVIKADEAKAAAGELDGPLWVVKAQIHAGGRGKGHFKEKEAGEKGGVRLAKSVSEAEELTRQMLGRTLVTHQTGEAGKQVNRLYIEDGSDIERELYLALLVDRGTSRISFVASTEGGMDIEEVAAKTPEKIVSFSVDPASGLSDFHGRRVAFALGLTGGQVKRCRTAPPARWPNARRTRRRSGRTGGHGHRHRCVGPAMARTRGRSRQSRERRRRGPRSCRSRGPSAESGFACKGRGAPAGGGRRHGPARWACRR